MENQTKNEERNDWKEAFKKRLLMYSVSMLHFCDDLRKKPALWPIADQLIRCSTSVGANVREAQGAGSRKDFANFFQIALKSANETSYWLEVVTEYNDIFKKQAEVLTKETLEITRIISSSLLTMKGKK